LGLFCQGFFGGNLACFISLNYAILGKLIFGSMFLGGVLRGELPQDKLIIIGFTGAVIFCVAGLILAASKEEHRGYSTPRKTGEIICI